METKFFRLFQTLYFVRKQGYKLKLFGKTRIYDVFYLSVLKQNSTRKKQVDKNDTKELDVDNKDSWEYKLEAISDGTIYVKESKSGHPLWLYNLVS